MSTVVRDPHRRLDRDHARDGGQAEIARPRRGGAAFVGQGEPSMPARQLSMTKDRALEVLADLTEPQRRCALTLMLVTNGDVAEAARDARELDPRDQVEARLAALF